MSTQSLALNPLLRADLAVTIGTPTCKAKWYP